MSCIVVSTAIELQPHTHTPIATMWLSLRLFHYTGAVLIASTCLQTDGL